MASDVMSSDFRLKLFPPTFRVSLALVSSAVAAPKVVKPPKYKSFRLPIESVPARGSRVPNFSLPTLQLPNQFASQSEKRSAADAGYLFILFSFPAVAAA